MVEKETKECPYCGEEILATAKKCKHCGEYLDDELRAEREPGNPESIDYSKCGEVKRGFMQGTPNIRCPRCGYKGTAQEKGFFKKSYVCPKCGENHLEKTGSNIGCAMRALIILAGFLLISFLTYDEEAAEQRRHQEQLENTVNPVQTQIDTLKGLYTDKDGGDYWPEFANMKCTDDKCSEVEMYFYKEPTDPGIDLVTRGQAVNLSRVAKKGVQVILYIDNKPAYTCVAYNGKIAEEFGNSGCKKF